MARRTLARLSARDTTIVGVVGRRVWTAAGAPALEAELRLACGCAQCVDEMTGQPRLNPASVSKDVWPQNIAPVGRYALHFDWSDGHWQLVGCAD